MTLNKNLSLNFARIYEARFCLYLRTYALTPRKLLDLPFCAQTKASIQSITLQQ